MMLELKFKKSNQNSNRLNQMANANEGGSCLVSLRLTLSQVCGLKKTTGKRCLSI